jgi:hypothetical protein
LVLGRENAGYVDLGAAAPKRNPPLYLAATVACVDLDLEAIFAVGELRLMRHDSRGIPLRIGEVGLPCDIAVCADVLEVDAGDLGCRRPEDHADMLFPWPLLADVDRDEQAEDEEHESSERATSLRRFRCFGGFGLL